MTYYEETVNNAIQAARKTGYNQVVYRDGENSFAFSRDYPDNYMYSPEDVVGRVRIHWQKGVMKPKYVRESQRTPMTAQELDVMVNAMRSNCHKVSRRMDITDEIYYLEKGLRAIGMGNLANELQELHNQIDSIYPQNSWFVIDAPTYHVLEVLGEGPDDLKLLYRKEDRDVRLIENVHRATYDYNHAKYMEFLLGPNWKEKAARYDEEQTKSNKEDTER